MKNNTLRVKRRLIAIAISILTSSSTMAAIYDLPENQQSNFNDLDQIGVQPDELESSSSFLETLQQNENSNKKKSYLEIFDLLKQNKLADARTEITALLAQNPREPEFYNLQALLEILEKDTTSARQSFQKAIQLDPDNLTAYLGLAKLTLDANDLNKAKEYSNKALAINNKSIKAYLVLADIAHKEKNPREVENILLTALNKTKGNVAAEIEVIKHLSKFYAANKQPDKILSLGQEIAGRYPNNSMALSTLAGAQLINGQRQSAEQTLLQLVNLDKQDINHRLLLARLFIEHPDKEKEVFKLLDEASEIDPSKPQALIFRTAYLTKLKRYREALENVDRINRQFPAMAIGKMLQGDVYLAEKKFDKALAAYQQVYQVAPNNKILFIIADLMNVQDNPAGALQFLNSELEKNPENNAIHFKLAAIHLQRQNYEQAETHYQAILRDQPDNALALNNLAGIYSLQHKPQALELAKSAYNKAPGSATVADTYGYILIKQGQHQEGLALLEKAAASAPQANDIQFHLAEAYSVNGNNKQAIEILENIKKSEQPFPEKEAAVNLLNQLKTN